MNDSELRDLPGVTPDESYLYLFRNSYKYLHREPAENKVQNLYDSNNTWPLPNKPDSISNMPYKDLFTNSMTTIMCGSEAKRIQVGNIHFC